MPISAPPPSWASIKNKPTTVAGFGISDMASQSVNYAATAGNGGVTSLNGQTGAITDTALGSIGSYYQSFNSQAITNGTTVAGSTLTYQDAAYASQNAGLSGTWRKMGATNSSSANVASQTFVRIA